MRARRILHRVGRCQSALLLSALYVLLWLPAGLLSRLFSDWLAARAPAGSAWRPRDPRLNRPEHVHHPF